MHTIFVFTLTIGAGVIANAHPAQPHANAFRAMVDQRQPVTMRVDDSTGYDGRGTATGGPVGGLANRN